jgi:hypothetical protein
MGRGGRRSYQKDKKSAITKNCHYQSKHSLNVDTSDKSFEGSVKGIWEAFATPFEVMVGIFPGPF